MIRNIDSRRAAFRLVSVAAVFLVMIILSTSMVFAETRISSPDNNAEKEVGKQVTITAKGDYVRPEGSSIFSFPKNYLYCRISKDDEMIDYQESSYTTALTSTKEFKFTPAEEGEYLIEVCHDITYEGDNHVYLEPEKFTAEVSITLRVWKSIAGAEISGLEEKVYTGSPITQTPTLVLDGKTLVPGEDYTAAYTNNINAGQNTAKVTFTGTGFYKKTVSSTFTIIPADINDAKISGIVDKPYTGTYVQQSPTVTFGDAVLTNDVDYQLSYQNNIKTGQATVRVMGIGNFQGNVPIQYTIERASIRNAEVSGISNKTYSGSPVTQSPTITYGGKRLVLDTDYSLSYKNNVELGTATVTITGQGDFKDSISRTFSILTPSSSGGFTTVMQPSNGASYAVGSNIEVVINARYDTPTYQTTTLTGMENYLYFKVTRDGERVLFDNMPYTGTNQNSYYFAFEFDASKAGVYTIEACRDLTYSLKNGNELYHPDIGYDDFVPASGIMVYVGMPERQDLSSATVTGVSDQEYTGNAITQSPTVKLGSKTLKNGTDYYVTYGSNVQVGTASMTIRGKGNYSGSISQSFAITPKNLTAAMMTFVPESFTYNGTLQKPEVTVRNGDIILKEGTDYTLTNEGGTEPGSYDVTISAATNGNYTGTASKSYAIEKLSIAGAVVTVSPASYVYDGSAKEPAVTSVALRGQILASDFYTVSYKDNVEAGTARATVTAVPDGYYTGTASCDFTIEKHRIDADDIAVSAIPDAVYTRDAQKPVPEVAFGETALKADKDYTVTYQKNTNAGKAEITITGKGNFSGSRKVYFNILKKDIADASVTVEPIPYQMYKNGDACTPEIRIKDGDAALTGEEFTAVYRDNEAPGTAHVTITGIGNYTGSIEDLTFEILDPREHAAATLADRIAEIEASGLEEYLPDDKAALQQAIDNAKACLADSSVTIEELEAALAALNEVKETADANWAAAQDAGSMPSAEEVEQALLAQKTDRDPAGSTIAPLLLKSTRQTKTGNKLVWKKAEGASQYIIYGGKCGAGSRLKKLATVTGTTYTHKKLKKGKYYKYVVVAVTPTVVGDRALAITKMIHVATKGGKVTNHKSITVRKAVLTKAGKLRAGGSLKLNAAVKAAGKVKKHVGLRYESSDPSVATVTGKGVVKAAATGACSIYVYAQNGVCRIVKVTVQ